MKTLAAAARTPVSFISHGHVLRTLYTITRLLLRATSPNTLARDSHARWAEWTHGWNTDESVAARALSRPLVGTGVRVEGEDVVFRVLLCG